MNINKEDLKEIKQTLTHRATKEVANKLTELIEKVVDQKTKEIIEATNRSDKDQRMNYGDMVKAWNDGFIKHDRMYYFCGYDLDLEKFIVKESMQDIGTIVLDNAVPIEKPKTDNKLVITRDDNGNTMNLFVNPEGLNKHLGGQWLCEGALVNMTLEYKYYSKIIRVFKLGPGEKLEFNL